jgi:hypothetical protein
LIRGAGPVFGRIGPAVFMMPHPDIPDNKD